MAKLSPLCYSCPCSPRYDSSSEPPDLPRSASECRFVYLCAARSNLGLGAISRSIWLSWARSSPSSVTSLLDVDIHYDDQTRSCCDPPRLQCQFRMPDYTDCTRGSVPLRRLRDVARAFAVANWVEVKRPWSGDELRQLADALDELGRQLRHQLVAVGAAEALVLQAVESLATPAALLGDTFMPLAVNGALRMRAGLTPDLEDTVFAEVRAELAAAVAEHRDLERVQIRALTRGTTPDDARFHLTALARPDAPPLWLVVLERPDRGGTSGDVQAAAAALADAEARLPVAAPELAELRRTVSELIAAIGVEPAALLEPARLELVLRTAVAGVGSRRAAARSTATSATRPGWSRPGWRRRGP